VYHLTLRYGLRNTATDQIVKFVAFSSFHFFTAVLLKMHVASKVRVYHGSAVSAVLGIRMPLTENKILGGIYGPIQDTGQ
jgi:hypothetical protein